MCLYVFWTCDDRRPRYKQVLDHPQIFLPSDPVASRYSATAFAAGVHHLTGETLTAYHPTPMSEGIFSLCLHLSVNGSRLLETLSLIKSRNCRCFIRRGRTGITNPSLLYLP